MPNNSLLYRDADDAASRTDYVDFEREIGLHREKFSEIYKRIHIAICHT